MPAARVSAVGGTTLRSPGSPSSARPETGRRLIVAIRRWRTSSSSGVRCRRRRRVCRPAVRQVGDDRRRTPPATAGSCRPWGAAWPAASTARPPPGAERRPRGLPGRPPAPPGGTGARSRSRCVPAIARSSRPPTHAEQRRRPAVRLPVWSVVTWLDCGQNLRARPRSVLGRKDHRVGEGPLKSGSVDRSTCSVRRASSSASVPGRWRDGHQPGAGQRRVALVADALAGSISGGKQPDPLGVAAADEVAESAGDQHAPRGRPAAARPAAAGSRSPPGSPRWPAATRGRRAG